ncbi:MAG TPA: DNA ligase D [Verrucomicrobiae bacterium]|nr:DNA ligase D [Verrucomicrobiae bacterium]
MKLDLSKLPKGKMPHQVKPMLATLVDDPFNHKDWLFEIKWDGFRTIAEIRKGKTEIYSRNLLSFNQLFAPIVKTLNGFKFEAVLDGEVVVVDEKGKSHFQLLQNYQNTGKGNLVYYVFDIIYLNGRNLTGLPLLDRKNILKQILPKTKNVRFSDHVVEKGVAFFKVAQNQSLEGVIAKHCQSSYKSGRRSPEWLKIKTHMRQEAVIGGFTQGRGSRSKFGALVLGVYEEDKLKYIGHTGGGFNEESLTMVYDKLKPLIQKTSPFSTSFRTNAPVTWVKPKLVAEVSFSEWTGDGHMRQPIFLGLRPDKPAATVSKEQPSQVQKTYEKNSMPKQTDGIEMVIDGNNLKLTHLNKIYWPQEKYTKGDLIDYYRKVSRYILPYLKDRPESLNRYPNGINGSSFFQKDVNDLPPDWAKTHKVYSESNDKYINYLICNDEATLAYMANLGCIEINPWSSRIGSLEKPDYLVVDLDPEKISFDKVIETAQTVHKFLDKLKVPNFCKTSGATGLHIYVPLGAKYTYEQAKQFTELVVTIVHKQIPEFTSLERSPKKRQKKVYLDFLQNRKGQTLAAAYSVRPKPGATVSTPLEWKEVKKGLQPSDFTIKNILKRLEKKGDLWKPVLEKGIDLVKILKKM